VHADGGPMLTAGHYIARIAVAAMKSVVGGLSNLAMQVVVAGK
jgi:hypothetical protein